MPVLTPSYVGSVVSRSYELLFFALDTEREGQEMVPSDLAALLDSAEWGLGDQYRDWFEGGDEQWR